jgi:hypothetical protein
MLYLDHATPVVDQIRKHAASDHRAIIVRPTNLEDVFLSLTGTSLEGGG